MKLDRTDIKRLQWAIALLIIMTAVGAGSVWSTLQLRKSAERSFLEASAARRDIQSRLARAREEQDELRDKIGRFQALKARGYIGPEQRLDWVEAIARVKTARRVFKLDYDFAPQRPVDPGILPGGAAAGGFEIMSSQMKLEVHLLHEGELLSLLADLKNAVQALVQVRACTLERIAQTGSERGSNAQIRAECTLEWITLKEGR